MPKKLTLQHCIDLAEDHGGKCMSEEYTGVSSQMLWECKYGHIFKANFRYMKVKNYRCKECYKLKNDTIRSNKNIKIAVKIATKRGGMCLSEVCYSVHHKLKWKCKNEHIFESKLIWVKNNNTWCKLCYYEELSRKKRLQSGILLAAQIAESKGGMCMSNEYINMHKKLTWICENEHTFEKSLAKVKNKDQWCPKCNNFCMHQNKVGEILHELLKEKPMSNYRDFGWLINPKTNRKLEIDLWFPELKLAVEYDGEQHFKPVAIFGGYEEFVKIVERDKIKDQLIKHNNCIKHFIRFSYMDDLSYDNIKNIIKSAGIQC